MDKAQFICNLKTGGHKDMTAVIGLLNKRGVAIAADSAVTRNRDNNEKVTKNGSKMLRMSNAVPISVMLTGNGDYICNPWDVVVRQYRRERGDIKHATVEACAHDFFGYIAKKDVFWNDDYINLWIRQELEGIFRYVAQMIPWELSTTKKDGTYIKPKAHLKAFIKSLKQVQKRALSNGIGHQFEDYTIEDFSSYAKPAIDMFLDSITETGDFKPENIYPKEFLEAIRPILEQTLMARLTTRSEGNRHAELVFSGYGEEQEYPSLVSAIVFEGVDHRVNYHIRPEDIICISDERPVAFCPFAQADVTKSIICGQHDIWNERILQTTVNKYHNVLKEFLSLNNEKIDFEFEIMLYEVEFYDLIDRYSKSINRLLTKNQHEWEKTLEHYDLKAMAALAESLIDLTGFHRILTFEQEGVGGPVDVAVITKNEGFTWLSRKSWYHHKDVNGMYGSLGI